MKLLQKTLYFEQPNRLAREYRQPQSVADFVLIDPFQFMQYSSMAYLFDKLPTGLPMAKDKGEKANKYYHKWQVNDFSHYTPNHKKYIHSLVFDLDPQANEFNFKAWSDVGLPPPNIIVANPSKPNSCQYVYLLEYPVYTSKQHIKTWLDDIYACMRDLLNADKFFNRTRSKNPFSPAHDCYVSGAEPYNLKELSEKCDLALSMPYKQYKAPSGQSATTAPPKQLTLAIEPPPPSNDPSLYDGRNHETFDKNRWVGYANAHNPNLYNIVLNACIQYQKRFDTPLDVRECEYIARSITKYCLENPPRKGDFVKTGEYSEQAKQRFSNHQRNRVNIRWKGYKDKRTQALTMLEQGLKQREICEKLGITKMTLSRWKKDNKIN